MADAVDQIIEQWAQERPDWDVSPIGVIGRISRLARYFESEISHNLAPFGITADEYDVLATLRRSGKPYALNPRDLLKTMMVTSATVTHRIDKLEKRGLIQRKPDPTDRRGVLVQLTREGKRLLDRAGEAHIAREMEMIGSLTKKEREQLTALLRRLSEATS
jgi:DNA-binding MarR family transcriptional regulator